MPDDLIGHIEDTRLTDALSERYLAYALSTIVSRSLPDVRDGLKPVHRRLIYAMHQLRLDPTAGFKKCARVVGDVIGKYHPHGDVAVYDALVRLAQDFAARYPLVEGQGNFGNIDGDNAAAMRYTEARLTEVARALLSGIDEDAVDFRPTYDGEESEPVVLPGAFPNLLANGAAGIAVGMATSIPPHNAGEVCAAAIHLIRHPGATAADLLAHMPGPDFPTGGVLVEDKAAILAAYETGRGGFRVRSKWEVEKGKHGTWQIVVTEIPYQVQKAKLVEQIAQLLEERKLPLLGDVRDESTEKVRLVLEPKTRGVEPEVLMETLFRASSLEARFPLNMNVLDATRTPLVMSLPAVLRAWLDHRHEVLLRRTRHRLAAIERRIEILDGYLLVYLNVDEVIRIIRNEEEPKPQPDAALQADRHPGRGDPEHAAAVAAQARGDGDRQGAQGVVEGAQGHPGAVEGRKAALGPHRRGTRGNAEEVRVGRAGRTANGTRRGAGDHGSGERGVCRARTDHRHSVRQGLDPRGEGPCRRRCRTALQGRRQAQEPAALPDHRPADAVRHQRPCLHAEGGRSAARPRRWPGGSPACRPDQRGRCRRAVHRGRGRALPGRIIDRSRFRRARRRSLRRRSAPASRC